MTFQTYLSHRGQPASSYKTYEEYVAVRQAQGLQVLPRKLFDSLKGK